MSEEMKDCPFCGGTPEYYGGWSRARREDAQKKGEKVSGREPSICCEECGIGFSAGWFGYGISDKSAKKSTIEAWNRRNN